MHLSSRSSCSIISLSLLLLFFFFFNDTATTEIYTLSLHDALPISSCRSARRTSGRRRNNSEGNPTGTSGGVGGMNELSDSSATRDRKSTRLNSSHGYISYAVFCLKKKKKVTVTSTQVSPTRRR